MSRQRVGAVAVDGQWHCCCLVVVVPKPQKPMPHFALESQIEKSSTPAAADAIHWVQGSKTGLCKGLALAFRCGTFRRLGLKFYRILHKMLLKLRSVEGLGAAQRIFPSRVSTKHQRRHRQRSRAALSQPQPFSPPDHTPLFLTTDTMVCPTISSTEIQLLTIHVFYRAAAARSRKSCSRRLPPTSAIPRALTTRFPVCSYPKHVWSPSGGWYCQPANWKRNTAIAFAVIFGIEALLFKLSGELEYRAKMPEPDRFFPSR
jgi:hypothetical protein